MLAHLRRNLVAYLALFIALSSTAVAAVTLEENSVLSKHIKDGAVKKADIKPAAVDASRVKDIQRALPLPLTSFVDCSFDVGKPIDFLSKYNDSDPDFLVSTGRIFTLRFDSSGGAEDDGNPVCTTAVVPPDAIGVVGVRVRASQPSEGGVPERIYGELNGDFISSGDLDDIEAAYLMPDDGPGPGEDAQINLRVVEATSAPAIDNPVDIHAVELVYTARQ